MPAWLLVLCLAAAPRNEGEVRLRWNAPAGCPSEAEVRNDVESLVGRPLQAGPVRLVASATVSGPPWRARFVARSSAGRSRRELVGESCQALARATAVIVAIALADARRLRNAPLASPARRPLPAVLTVSPVRVRWPWVPRARVGAGAEFGVFPAPSFVVSGSVDWTRTDLRLRLGGYYRAGLDQRAEGRELGYGSAGARFEGCWVRARLGWELEACGGAETGGWWVRDRRSGARFDEPWVAAAAGVGLAARLVGPLWATGFFGAAFPLVRPDVQVTTQPNRPELNVRVFRPEPVVPRLQIGLAGRFR